jgi:glycosyltransferase involved in cell wall biosynthesis
LIATSQYLADQLPSAHIVAVVANAIEPDRFDRSAIDRASARARLGLGEAELAMAVVGQISPHKGQSDAIRALELVRRTHPDACLLLVGSVKFASAATRFDNRAYADELATLAGRLGVRDSTIFLGERADIAEILAAVEMLLVPSWYEPFGRVALEAMIMQVPVIATSVGGIKEVLTDGVDGLVLAPKEPWTWAAAIIALLSDPSRRSAMGASGRQRALCHFSPRNHVREITDVYVRVLNCSGGD